MKRKQTSPDGIHDVTELIEFKIAKTIYDGTKRKRANLYLVDVRRVAGQKRRGKSRRAASSRVPTSVRCVLKVFPAARANEDDYRREVAANAELGRSTAASTPGDAIDAMIDPAAEPIPVRWPRCYGTLRVSEHLPEAEWLSGSASSDARYAILFEYIPDLQLLTKEDVTEELALEIKQLITDLHALKILHRDHISHMMWPEVGFNNLFLRADPETGGKDLFILDFDKAVVLGESARDKILFANEVDRINEVLEQAVSGKAIVETLPREVQKLLADRLV